MEHMPSWQSLPPDSVDRTALLLFFASLVCACVALFGERLPWLFLGIPAVCTLVLYACLLPGRRLETCRGFTLDDTARELRPTDGRAIPFSAITASRLILYRDRACLHVMTGPLRRRRFRACIGRPGPARDLVQELSGRSLPVRISRNPFRKRTADILPLIIMPVLAAALLYVSIDMLERLPGAALTPRRISIAPSAGHADWREHRLGPLSFSLPRDYRQITTRKNAAVFLSPEAGASIALDVGPDRPSVPHKPLLQAAAGLLGFGSIHEAAMLAVRSRFGLLPVLIKTALLKRYDADTVMMYLVEAGPLRGIMVRGEQLRPAVRPLESMPEQAAEIILRHAGNGLVVRILLFSPLPPAPDMLGGLIAGMH